MNQVAGLLQPSTCPERPSTHPNSGLHASPELMRKPLFLKNVLLVPVFLLMGCVYQAPIAQGNLLKQEDVDQVEVGMTRSQVRFLLGTPMIDDPFHADRWDYVYYLKIGRRDATFKRWVSVIFDGDNVAEIIEDQELSPDL